MPQVLAVLATVPGREEALQQCLASLRPQVSRIHVVCHDTLVPPDPVKEFADEWICEPDEQGSAAKLRWAGEWTGLYLGCDDDLRYPPNYTAEMHRWVKRWRGKALCTAHGRVLKSRAVAFTDARASYAPRGKSEGAWLNYPGGCALAFDTRLGVPSWVPGKNLEEAHLAVWAQRHRVPIWLVPHAPDWLTWLLAEKNVPTIWAEEKGAGFANRNAVLSQLGAHWLVHHV